MLNQIELCSASNCTQCGACIELCPRKAISFSLPDKNGDKYPFIDELRCIQCGICQKGCPQLSRYMIGQEKNFLPKYFAGWSKKHRLKGSSGGVFCELAEWAINNNGYVCGAGFDNNGILKHQLVNQMSQVKPLLGSKYTTSEAHAIFPLLKSKLKKDRLVLFVGTPCQVAGLKSFLKLDYDNLITVDLVCFGCPSQEIYQAYIKKIPTNSPIVGYKFRRLDSNRPDNQILLANGVCKHISNRYYTYIDGFVRGLCMKKACYNCHYKNLNRVGDITLGDYHTIRSEKPLLRAKISKGVSLICVNTQKGETFLRQISTHFELFDKSYSQASMTNVSLREQLEMPSSRDAFCASMYSKSISLENINKQFGLYGLKFSWVRFNPLFIKILDFKKDIIQLINSIK
ncbi:Coenzyme F420 hydrogenase/dehydrogenase, beta subunit C-terminal domain [Leyella stercorea]|uniref:Coenzyme F420 hydrogenase/dehydrogenase, beta subunit C-terminal domain n=1 Tax=Leyella stercorea TaxID=363265 RepID=UPI00242D49E5|nr:Coenzyme F420 hydrogenase/dehydrogenase, beta subunit C-terminal domain [Leyella stercorea]